MTGDAAGNSHSKLMMRVTTYLESELFS